MSNPIVEPAAHKVLLVVAGNHHEFEHWRIKNQCSRNDRRFRYISHPAQLYAFNESNAEMLFTGTWYTTGRMAEKALDWLSEHYPDKEP